MRPEVHLYFARASVVLCATAFAAYFSLYACTLHDLFRTYAFDLGTFDQGVWLVSRGLEPFVTVRGLHLLGDHVRLFSYVLAPVYWVFDDVRVLLVLQSVVVASGAWLLSRIAEKELPGRPWLGASLSVGYLLHPAVQNLVLDQLHADAFATTLILAAVYFLRCGRVLAFAGAAALAMSCKEDIPLVFVVMGLMLLQQAQRRTLGVATVVAAGAYFVLCIFLILPHFNGIGFFRTTYGAYAGFGRSGLDPQWLWDRLMSTRNAGYLLALGAPHLLLFLVAPFATLPAVPSLLANLLSDSPYMSDLQYHYQTSIVPFLFVATVDALARMAARRSAWGVPTRTDSSRGLASGLRVWGEYLAPALLVVAAVVANARYSKVPLLEAWSQLAQLRLERLDPRPARIREALASIPRDAVVSADYTLVPHLTHRRAIYVAPNPFSAVNWGIHGENADDPGTVDFILFRPTEEPDEPRGVVNYLVRDGHFEQVSGDDTIAVYHRIPPPAPALQASCGDWNGDGSVNDDDFRQISSNVTKHLECAAGVCDTDGDGVVAFSDLVRLRSHIRELSIPLLCPE